MHQKNNNISIQHQTPKKRRKVNENISIDSNHLVQFQMIKRLNSKTINNTLSTQSKSINQAIHSNNISQFKSIDIELPQLKLSKRITMQQNRQKQKIGIDLSLYRHNSTFEAQIISQDIKYGDNVYIEQIMSLSKGKSISNSNHKFKMQQSERLMEDYQIRRSIHENYICLNKLERILYYVKKISFSINQKQYLSRQQIMQIINLQIHLSANDSNALLLRYFNSWTEHNSLYMIFQLASTSLEEKTRNGIRMHEYEVWSVLSDTCKSLSYLQEQNYCHLNIKPGNIIKCRQKYKLADPFCKVQFIVSILEKTEESIRFLYNPYTAPQLIYFYKYTEGLVLIKCDIYSLGMCILENLLGGNISSLNQRSQHHQIKTMMNSMLQAYSPKLKRTLLRMLSKDPCKRPFPKQLYQIEEDEQYKNKIMFKRKLSF